MNRLKNSHNEQLYDNDDHNDDDIGKETVNCQQFQQVDSCSIISVNIKSYKYIHIQMSKKQSINFDYHVFNLYLYLNLYININEYNFNIISIIFS